MEVDFGDTELFEQFGEEAAVQKHIRFTEEDEDPEHVRELRDRLEESEETINRLKTENMELKRKLNFLSRPAGINVVNSKLDGPLFHVLFGNNSISKQSRQEMEDCILNLVQKQQYKQNEKEASALHPGPQNSSFVMHENQKTNSSSKQLKDAFCVVGSVLYFTTFCLDKLGQPLLNENPQLTEGWEIPKYQQVFAQVIALEGQEVQIKEKRPKPCCFNCGADSHQLRDCPKPKDMARINEKRREFAQTNSQGNNQRYHAEEVEERFSKYKPGVVSQELLDALGIVSNMLPPYIYRMRELGYPPGWLKEAEMENSGLTLYDGKTSGEDEESGSNQDVTYDVSKLVDFPGFNVSAPPNVRDDFRSFGSIPMQPQHCKATFAAFLSAAFPSPGSKCAKRSHEANRMRRCGSDLGGSSDMDTDSDHDTPKRARSDSFQFQPPLPPGSPLLSTPPPLPPGTPPVTPTPPPLPKGTPPPTPPTNVGSPILSSRGSVGGEESEDGLTLEELEEQQRLLWAALDRADNGTSDSDTGATGTPGMGSPRGSNHGEEMEVSNQGELPSSPASPAEAASSVSEEKSGDDQTNEDAGTEACDELIVLDEVSQETDSSAERNGENAVPDGEASPAVETRPAEDADEEDVVMKITSVPHRSKFAEGIIPFEDTPEFTEVAEATGVYLRIRGLLKESPRNQAKSKKRTV